jgi:hypothetical protein
MVEWYNPLQLLQTAQQVVASTVFGRHADHRLLEALADTAAVAHDDFRTDANGQPREEIWIDYVADTGDGWNSTYAVASSVARETLPVGDQSGRRHETLRGHVLVFGGDEVYPTPSRSQYEARLVGPYEAALRSTAAPHPRVFAIPGNHDWYDSLVSFTRLFCSKAWFAGWQAPQRRSYFALQLPHGWWLVGTDVQLGSDIDAPQVDFFKHVASQMHDGDRIILCDAEPHWIYATIYQTYDREVYNESNLEFLEQRVFGRKVSVFLAGDLHHYRRHAAADGTQKITAGGGGAFLHPTHGPDVPRLPGGFTRQSSFPDVATSKRLCWRNLLFPWLNWKFGILPAAMYTLTAWAVMADIGGLGMRDLPAVLLIVLRTTLGTPFATFWVAALFLGFWLFTDTHSKTYRWIMGSVHGSAHLLAAFSLSWAASYVAESELGYGFKSLHQLLVSGILVFSGGWLVGSFIMGVYLLVSLNVFGRHSNEAFSALAIPDWKSFLRLKIDRRGDLTIFPIGIRRVPRKWKPRAPGTGGAELVPDDERATPPELIEAPIIVAKHGRPT